jgi:hypothetical protein
MKTLISILRIKIIKKYTSKRMRIKLFSIKGVYMDITHITRNIRSKD